MEVQIGENCRLCIGGLSSLTEKAQITTAWEDQAKKAGTLVTRGQVECPKGPREVLIQGEIGRVCRAEVELPDIRDEDFTDQLTEMWPGAPVPQPQE